MKPVRTIRPRANGIGKTPIKLLRQQSSEDKNDLVEVYCRIRTPEVDEDTHISLTSTKTLMLVPSQNDIIRNRKAIQYTFSHIFTEHADQKEIFDHVTLPLLLSLIRGENGLLLTYGVTGSGKTYTMTGEKLNPGVIPRSIHVLFNTIGRQQTEKFQIKSDRMNNFEIQSEHDAFEEREREVKLKRRIVKRNLPDSEIVQYVNDGTKLPIELDETVEYTVFVSYVEIYNNIVYDLLDDIASGQRTLQAKIVREDANHNIYVNGVAETEVKSTEEALELYSIGKRRKRMGQTALNTESSRSHSIFTIRLVSKQQLELRVAQLSLVDLAGSERCSRTQTAGVRLKEAGRINNSLMSLRTCLEILRENQQTGGNRIVPYRESRLTLLFKNFFEGDGKVKMIVCVNPSLRDYDENIHIMKFAEATQEVKVLRPELIEVISSSSTNSRISVSVQTDDHFNTFLIQRGKRTHRDAFPRVCSVDPESEELKDLLLYLKRCKVEKSSRRQIIQKLDGDFRANLVSSDELKRDHEEQVKFILPAERQKVKELKDKLLDLGYQHDKTVEECQAKDNEIEQLRMQLAEQSFKLKQHKLDKEKHKRRLEENREKMNHELDTKLRRQRDYYTADIKQKENKLDLMKDILTNNVVIPDLTSQLQSEVCMENMNNGNDDDVANEELENVLYTRKRTPLIESANSSEQHVPRREAPVANIRFRRSRSAGDVWLEHRPPQATPLGTVLQPVLRRRKSVSKLTDPKVVVDGKQSKYLLISQGQDPEGDLETKLYKGDIIPTCSGGAQVIFDDVEKLKQESPMKQNYCSPATSTPVSATIVAARRRQFDLDEKCSVSIEGHGKRTNSKK